MNLTLRGTQDRPQKNFKPQDKPLKRKLKAPKIVGLNLTVTL